MNYTLSPELLQQKVQQLQERVMAQGAEIIELQEAMKAYRSSHAASMQHIITALQAANSRLNELEGFPDTVIESE